MTERAQEAMWGAVDLHCHSGPNPIPRIFDHVGAARDGDRLGMQAILAKSHHHNTVMDLLAMAPQFEGIGTKVYGGEFIRAGGIIVRQVGMTMTPGPNVGLAKDFTLFALCDGHVKFGWESRTKKRVSVEPVASSSAAS